MKEYVNIRTLLYRNSTIYHFTCLLGIFHFVILFCEDGVYHSFFNYKNSHLYRYFLTISSDIAMNLKYFTINWTIFKKFHNNVIIFLKCKIHIITNWYQPKKKCNFKPYAVIQFKDFNLLTLIIFFIIMQSSFFQENKYLYKKDQDHPALWTFFSFFSIQKI